MITDDTWTLIIFTLIIVFVVGAFVGNFAASFMIPSCKIWDNSRSYDKILIADDVICTPAHELNTTYYRYDIARYNGTDYVVQKVQVGNSTAKGMIVCR